jgi:hypothetical protein
MRLATSLLLACSVIACARTPPLPHSQESPEALARAVLVAIERRDAEALNNLALNEDEFREHVWPELPASRPERNLPLSYVWGDLHQKSNAALGQTLARHGGRKYELRAVRFTGEATEYSSYRVMRKSEVTVRDPQGGEQNLRVFGSVIEKGGRFKVFSYVTED